MNDSISSARTPKRRVAMLGAHRNGHSHVRSSSSAALRDPFAQLREVWHRLAVNLLEADALGGRCALGIASAVREEGRSTTAAGLAYALAREVDGRVALLEADIAHPTLSFESADRARPGLINVLKNECALGDTYAQTSLPNLTLVPADPRGGEHLLLNEPHDLAALLRARMPNFLEALKGEFVVIVTDLPPVLSNLYGQAMAGNMDRNLMLVRAGISRLPETREALQQVNEDSVLGVLHTGPRSGVPAWMTGLLTG